MRPIGIGETLLRSLAKIVMRAAGDQAKTVCVNIQLCAGHEAGIKGDTHAVGQRRLKRVHGSRQEGEEAEDVEEEGESGRVDTLLNNLTIKTAGTEEEAAVQLEEALEMEVEETGEVEEGGDGTIRALGALEFLIQDVEMIGTTLVDARNGFNELSRLAMLWNMWHRWTEGARFAFNCYRHWAQLLLCQPGEPPVTILSRERITQGDPLSMLLYRITLSPLAAELRAAYPGRLSPFYVDDADFDGKAQQSAQLINLLMKRGPD